MLGLVWEPCPAAVAAIDATMMDVAMSPGTKWCVISGSRLCIVPTPATDAADSKLWQRRRGGVLHSSDGQQVKSHVLSRSNEITVHNSSSLSCGEWMSSLAGSWHLSNARHQAYAPNSIIGLNVTLDSQQSAGPNGKWQTNAGSRIMAARSSRWAEQSTA